MHKSKKAIIEATDAYIDELRRQYPGVEVEPTGPFDSFDNWLRVLRPPELQGRWEEIQYFTIELNFRFSDEAGVEFIATVVEKEPVHG